MMNPSETKPCLLWSCVARNDVVLAEASSPTFCFEEYVGAAKDNLLKKKATPGWEFATFSKRNLPKLKGIKFHIYEHTSTEPENDGLLILPQQQQQQQQQQQYGWAAEQEEVKFNIWVFACVYDPNTVEQIQAQSFIEKIIGITEIPRMHDPTWQSGSHLAAQETFGGILSQRMEEVEYLGKYAMVNNQLESLKKIMSRNIEMILDNGEQLNKLKEDASNLNEMAAVFKKQSKNVKRQMLWQNAKHGLLLGSAISAGVAAIVVPIIVL